MCNWRLWKYVYPPHIQIFLAYKEHNAFNNLTNNTRHFLLSFNPFSLKNLPWVFMGALDGDLSHLAKMKK
jgi:hypothetical protein